MRMANNGSPVRSCVGCRARFAQNELVRYVRGGDGGAWRRDRRRRAPGRGAYLCSPACAVRVRKNRRYPGLADAAMPDFASDPRQCMIEPPPGRPEHNDMK